MDLEDVPLLPPIENFQYLLCAELSVTSFYSLLKDPYCRWTFSFTVREVEAQAGKTGARIPALVHPWPRAMEQSLEWMRPLHCLQMGTLKPEGHGLQRYRGSSSAGRGTGRPACLLCPPTSSVPRCPWASHLDLELGYRCCCSCLPRHLPPQSKALGKPGPGLFFQDKLPRCWGVLCLSFPCNLNLLK